MTTISHKAVQAFKDVFHGSPPKSYDDTIKEGLAAALPYLYGPFPAQVNSEKLIKALSNIAGNRHTDGKSSVVSAEDRSAIIDGCFNLMVALKLAKSVDDVTK